MVTGFADMAHVGEARDLGVSEVLGKCLSDRKPSPIPAGLPHHQFSKLSSLLRLGLLDSIGWKRVGLTYKVLVGAWTNVAVPQAVSVNASAFGHFRLERVLF